MKLVHFRETLPEIETVSRQTHTTIFIVMHLQDYELNLPACGLTGNFLY
ncbi:MAG TPA: hypothetical protein VF421_04760 [Niabella sp.]